MTQTPESFDKEVTDFFDHFNKFEYIADKRQNTISQNEILPLFAIFMDHHKYIEVQ